MKAFSVAITSGMKAERKRQRTFRRNTALATERGKKRRALAYRKRVPGLAKGKFSEAVYIPLRAFFS